MRQRLLRVAGLLQTVSVGWRFVEGTSDKSHKTVDLFAAHGELFNYFVDALTGVRVPFKTHAPQLCTDSEVTIERGRLH